MCIAMSRLPYKWAVATVFVFGLFMDLLDMTITNVALPTLAREFRAGTTAIEWVVTGYLLSLAVFIPVSGWVGDRFGTKRAFMFALGTFTLASLLCATAWNIQSLILFRVMQGVGGGMLTPVGTAMLFRAFPPEERARASAVLAIPTAVAPATGPVLGGYLTEYWSWHWIFLVNVPIGLIGLLTAALILREERQAQAGRLDLPGFVLSAAGLAAVVYALTEAGLHGFGDRQVQLFGLVGLAALTAFVAVERRTAEPLIDVRLFRDRLFSASNTVMFVSLVGFAGVLFLLPLLLQAERGLTPLQSGLTTFPQAIGVALMMPLASRLYGRLGPRRMMMTALTGSALTTLAFVAVGLTTNLWWVRAIMLARGVAFAFLLVPLQAATFATIHPTAMGRASAAFNSIRQVAASFGVALLATVLSNRLAHQGAQLGNPFTRDAALAAFHDAFLVGAAISALGIAVCLLIDDRLVTRDALESAPVTGERLAAIH
jgi:EmrB/QacA subfamily drug resistance transporter